MDSRPDEDIRFFVTACLMGYGHLRAAHNVISCGQARLIRVDRKPNVSCCVETVWRMFQGLYHGLSRTAGVNQSCAMNLLEKLVAISQDGSGTSLATARLAAFFSLMGLGNWSGQTREYEHASVLHTFYLSALHSAYHGRAGKDFLLICDTDCQRVWAPINPKGRALTYLVPCPSVADRLLDYGVRSNAIEITGFPLPVSNLGGPPEDVACVDYRARTKRLACDGGPLTLMFPVSGAGCYLDLLRSVIQSLMPDLREGRIRVIIAAGENSYVNALLSAWLDSFDLPERSCVQVLYDEDIDVAFDLFNDGLRRADIMLTKPGELVFYAALGIPFVLFDPVGEHEQKNRSYLMQGGAAIDFPGTDQLAEWLVARRRDGTWERLGSNGFAHFPRDGVFRIDRLLSDDCA